MVVSLYTKIAVEYLATREAAPAFALPNQLLVWVAKIVLAQPDLDLMMAKCYK